MLRIAICDDDSNVVEAHAKVAEDSIKKCMTAAEVTTYTSSENLLYDITEDKYFYDSMWHLTDEGAILRTERVAQDLLKALGKKS